ncbi:MAG TPA: sulfurtransferase TusA family protein [Acidiferrobacter sp.]|nr:sulfurtransferase TusA family protein [Acidiferrobacter sp.]
MPHLDARYLLCPMPVIRVGACIANLVSGDVLTVTCTDRGALNDVPAWCRLEGHEVIQATTDPYGDVRLTIRVKK